MLEGHTRDVLCIDVQKEAAFSGKDCHDYDECGDCDYDTFRLTFSGSNDHDHIDGDDFDVVSVGDFCGCQGEVGW